MKIQIYTRSLTFLALAFLASLASGADGWQTDLKMALEQAKQENKPLLLEFTGSDYCPPCIMMQRRVFSKKNFIEQASEQFILVKIDSPQRDKEVAKNNEPHFVNYKVTALPTVLLLSPKGIEYDRFIASEFDSVRSFLKRISRDTQKSFVGKIKGFLSKE